MADEKPQDATALHPPKPKIHDEIAEVESVASSGVSGLYLVNSPECEGVGAGVPGDVLAVRGDNCRLVQADTYIGPTSSERCSRDKREARET